MSLERENRIIDLDGPTDVGSNDGEQPEPVVQTYQVPCKCLNCGFRDMVKITRGSCISQFCCPICDCAELVRDLRPETPEETDVRREQERVDEDDQWIRRATFPSAPATDEEWRAADARAREDMVRLREINNQLAAANHTREKSRCVLGTRSGFSETP